MTPFWSAYFFARERDVMVIRDKITREKKVQHNAIFSTFLLLLAFAVPGDFDATRRRDAETAWTKDNMIETKMQD